MPTQRIQRKHAGLLVVDVQERLLPAIGEAARLVENVIRLIKGATILDLPIFVTEQYRKGLGPDRKSTRLNSSHTVISYAVFCLKKKKHKHMTCDAFNK